MADKKISALSSATTPLAGTEVLPIVQAGTTVKVTIADITAGRSPTATSFTGTSSSTTGNYPLVAENSNTSSTVGKFTGAMFKGADTIATPKNVGALQIIPNDINWVDGSLAFLSRTGDALTEKARIDPAGFFLIGYSTSNGSYKLQVNSQIFATSATIATSDARYKEDVTSVSDALALVKKLRPVTFRWKPHPVHQFDLDNVAIGFIAQEVQTALEGSSFADSIVKSNECEIEPGKTEDFLGIAESSLVPLLVAALKEANDKIDALSDRVAKLEG